MVYKFECGFDDPFTATAHSEDEVVALVKTHVNHHNDEQHTGVSDDEIRDMIKET